MKNPNKNAKIPIKKAQGAIRESNERDAVQKEFSKKIGLFEGKLREY